VEGGGIDVRTQETKAERRKVERLESKRDGSIEDATPLGQWSGGKTQIKSLRSHTHTNKTFNEETNKQDLLIKGAKFL
jgi:hypothetical protein